MFSKPWWIELPERLEWEFKCLSSAGYRYQEISRNEAAGILELIVEYPASDRVLKLRALFPPFFPDARVEVCGDDLELVHHQNPYNKALCLLGRSTALWDPNTSLASFLTDQMPLLLKAGTTEEIGAAASLEEHQAEPATAFLPFLEHSAVLLHEQTNAASTQSGRFTAYLAVPPPAGNLLIVRGIIDTIDDQRQWTPVIEGENLIWQFTNHVHGRWFNVTKVSAGLSAEQFVKEISHEHPTVLSSAQQFDLGVERCELLGFVIPSEIGHRVEGTEWVLVLRRKSRNISRKNSQRVNYDFVRVERFGRDLMYQRSPELKNLANKCVAVVGLGCIGAPSAIEFAKAGIGELRLLDGDKVEAGTVVRWPLGLPWVGHYKVNAVMNFVQQNFPLTKVWGMITRIGAPPIDGKPSLGEWRSFFDGIDILFDATAEMGVSSILSHIATELSVPFVCVSASHGGWGGMVVTYDPHKTGCYDCFLRHVDEGTIPQPPESPAPRIQTAGCADPTYIATAFDASELSLTGVRTAVSLLTRDVPGGYPHQTSGVAVLSLRDKQGAPVYPQWQCLPLTVHPKCPHH